eukprot:s1201_g10.t1
MLRVALWLGLVYSGFANDCSNCEHFPRICDDVEYCIESCGTLRTYEGHCAKLRSFESFHPQPIQFGDNMPRRAHEEIREQDVDERTVMRQMMSPEGHGPRRSEM